MIKHFKYLFGFLGEYKKAAIITPIITAAEVVLEVLIPFIIALLIDRGITAGSLGDVLFYGGLMLVMAFLSLLCGILAGKYAAYASSGFACNLRDALFTKIQTYSFSNIDTFSTAGLITRLTTDITNLQNAFQMIIRIAIRAPFMMVSSLVMAFIVNVRLSFIFLVVLVALALILGLLMMKIMPVFQEVFRKYDELNASTQENISGIRVVKAFVREKYEGSRFKTAAENLYRLSVKAEGILALASPVMMLGIFGSIIAISWLGAQFIVIGTLTTGELTSMFSYLMSILLSLVILMAIFVMISMSSASAKRITEVFEEMPDIVNPDDPVTTIPDGSIDFDNVGFAYREGSGEGTLHGIDIHIDAGETIGIVGGTGSGKSTLVSLISRLYDVNSGCVRVGGIDVRDYDIESLRDGVAVVLQKNVLFSGTILENLRWGKEDATEEECVRACQLACADGFIQNLPNGYETYIEQGGSNVSGGQKQRLCIARALLKNPKVLVLDDSTSAVDTATDARIRRAFSESLPDTTKLIIAQRVSSVQHADRIIVLDDGGISGIGTHEELLENNDIYRDIYETQTRSGGDFDEARAEMAHETFHGGSTEGGGWR